MSVIDFILVPILYIIHVAAAFVIPIVATLRSQNNGQRWIIHWVVFILLRLTLFQLLDLLFDGAIYYILLVGAELGLLFALAQHTQTVKQTLLQLVDQATAISRQYFALAKQQLQKVQQQAAKTTQLYGILVIVMFIYYSICIIIQYFLIIITQLLVLNYSKRDYNYGTFPLTQSFFLSYFRSLISKDCDISVELKNGVTVIGKIKYIDNNMCIFLEQVSIKNKQKYGQLVTLSNMFIRGSAIKYIHPPFDQTLLSVVADAAKSQ